MAILHGNWSFQGHFLIWGETWRRTEPISALSVEQISEHPFALTADELTDWLTSLQQNGIWSAGGNLELILHQPWQYETLALPTWLTETLAMPQHSAGSRSAEVPQEAVLCLCPWRVGGLALSPQAAIAFLRTLPLGQLPIEETFFGSDLRYWSHVARWSLDLLARSKFLPVLERRAEGVVAAGWKPLLDSASDQERLDRFAQQMPLVCRLYRSSIEEHQLLVAEGGNWSVATAVVAPLPEPEVASPYYIDVPVSPRLMLRHFLHLVLNAQVKATAQQLAIGTGNGRAKGGQNSMKLLLEQWLEALANGRVLTSETPHLDRLQVSLTQWAAPLQPHLKERQPFRTCLKLHPPLVGRTDWTLEYFLQSSDDPEFLVEAPVIWKNPVERLVYLGRSIYHPQETLLAGLGLASRLCGPIEPSLKNRQPQFCYLTPLQAYEFLKTTAWRLQDSGFGVILPPSLANREGWANRLGLKIRAGKQTLPKDQRLGIQSLLNFQWELSIGGQTLSKADLDRLVAMNTPLVEINGEWVELRPQDVRAAQSFFANRKDKVAMSLQDVLRIGTGDTQVVEKLPIVGFEAGPLQDLITTLTGDNRDVRPIELPREFRGTLRPYQARGAGWLTFLEQWGLGACLADDMGLGKTVQTIAFLLHLKQENQLNQPVLLICPTSVLGNWEREVKKFGPILKTVIHHGDKRLKGKAFASAIKGRDLIITSYALVHRDASDLQSQSWQMVILDEAQNIKNAEAKQSQAVRQIPALFRLALTGTPVENRLAELWSIMDFLNPGYLGPKNFFQRRFAVPIEKYGDTASLQTLRSLVQPFVLRRLKTDREIIQDLPEKQEMTVFCTLSAEQASLYQREVERSLALIEAADGIQRKGLILALLVKLKQICNHPAHFLKLDQLSHHHSGKLQRLEEMLEEIIRVGDRALIFTQFAEWGKLLQRHLQQKLGQEALFIYGSIARKQREEMVDRFQNDPQGPRLLILSLKAGGTGLNLTRANHVFHFDRWWNPAMENQATDRAFRIGQTRNVQVHKFVCTGTLEERIHDLIESKKALAEQVVGAGEQWLTEMNLNQLRDLLLLDRAAIIDDD